MSFTLWFTGLPDSGKTTISRYLIKKIKKTGVAIEVLDSDEVGSYLQLFLGTPPLDRESVTRCIGFISYLLNKNNIVSIAVSTSSRAQMRSAMRNLIDNFVEVYCQCSLEVAEARDSKGLYQMARAGKIDRFTGIDETYEEPDAPEIVVHTDKQTVEECGNIILNFLVDNNFLVENPPLKGEKNDK